MRPRALAATVVTLLAQLIAPGLAGAAGPWRWPVEGRVITPYSNGSDPYASGQHRGIDIAAAAGTPVIAATAGVVTFAGVAGSSGLTVAVRTDDGFDTSYLHLAAVAVGAGERVASGAPIGSVGTTGRRSAAEPHLHFGVREAGTRFAYRDPLDFLPAPPLSPVEPRALPVRLAVPARPAPALQPVPGRPLAPPAPASLGLSAPASLRAPAPALVPLPAAAPLSSRAPAARALPATSSRAPRATSPVSGPAATASAGRVPTFAAPRRSAGARVRDAHAPRPSLGPSHDGASRLTRRTTSAPGRNGARRAGPGIDLGWLAACIAMVAAAGILGRPRATTRSLRRAFDPSHTAHEMRLP